MKAITLTRANKRVWQRLNEGIEKHMADKDNINKNKYKTNSVSGQNPDTGHLY